MVLAEMPLTPNGKIDKKALRALEVTFTRESEIFQPPANPTEEILSAIWSQLLPTNGHSNFGRYDNFFDLGGHSLLATRLLSRIRTLFHVEIPLRVIFEKPVLHSLANEIDKRLGTSSDLLPPITRHASKDPLPLSFAQQRLWFLEQLDPDNRAYHIPAAIRLSGNLSVPALARGLDRVVQRHEVLRTRFSFRAELPIQIVTDDHNFQMWIADVSELPEAQRETEMRRLVQVEIQRPFDLAQGSLIRTGLIRLTETDHTFVVTMHHIISDGWSLGVLVREIASQYESEITNRPAALESLPVQYSDYALWQREWLRGEALDSQLAYWREQLEGAPTVLELPTDKMRPAVQTFAGAYESVLLPPALADSLNRFSDEEGVTLFMTLLAAFQTLLWRYTGQKQFLIGTPVANRKHEEIENLIGFFVNTLVLRANISASETCRELLARVREICLGAYAHQDLPLEMLVEELQPERDLSRSPLIQVLLVLQNAPLPNLDLPELSLTPLDVDKGTAIFDLTLSIAEEQGSLKMSAEYNTDLFEPATMRRLLGHYQTLLAAFVSQPAQHVAQLPLLTESERQQILIEWNDTRGTSSEIMCIQDLFEAQTTATPEATALISTTPGIQFTYRQLNQRANQLAHYLRALGVGPDSAVGICLERSSEMMVAVLGVLKAGGAYVPLDPGYPADRFAFMLEDSRATVLLTQQRLLDRLPEHRMQTVCVDGDWEKIELESIDDPDSLTTADNLAYIIYTSGSTGRPKGVAMPHRPLVNLISYQIQLADRLRTARTLQFASLSFDVSFQEMFSTWAAGGTLVLIDEEVRFDARELHRVLAEQRIERLYLPFVALQQLAEVVCESELDGPLSLREVLTAGEQLKITKQIRELMRRVDGCRLENQYGPSECHVVSTFLLDGPTGKWPELPPIGRPITNTQQYVLDEWLQLAPVGVTGELYLGGESLARGYLNRPELSAEKFIPDPYSVIPGRRLYRTGDLARYRADGQVDFLGRRDSQVKIRGFRVELGEIETVLEGHPDISEAIVTVHSDDNEQKRLVAYWVGSGATAVQLRSYLQERLPAYMVPPALVQLDKFPLTPSGKVDRRALPDPIFEPAQPGCNRRPGNAIEEMLVDSYCDVLRLDQVGVRDDFFDLGGHSLLATQVVSRIRKQFKIELPVRALFEYPTIVELAEQVERAIGAGRHRSDEPIEPRQNKDHPPLSFAQHRLWFLGHVQPNSNLYHIPAVARMHGRLNVTALEQSFNDVIRRHDALRTGFELIAGQPVQVIAAELDPLRLPVVDLSSLPDGPREAEVRRLVQADATMTFDLEVAPLLRLTLLREGELENRLVITMHHVISDGWSVGILVRELSELYSGYVKGERVELPELRVQYADYSEWQRNWLQGEVLEEQLGYWRKHLSGALPELQLPLDHARVGEGKKRGGRRRIELNAELSSALEELGRRRGATLFMVLQAGLTALLHRYSGQEEIVTGTVIANRNRMETEGVIGFFVNALALRVNCEGEPRYVELLERVKEVLLGAYAHQDIPYEKVVQELGVVGELNRNPLFEVLFVLQNGADEEVDMAGLAVAVEEVETETAKFDLNVTLQKEGKKLGGYFEYNAELFEEATIARMVGHYEVLLQSIVRNEEERIGELELLTTAELDQLLSATGPSFLRLCNFSAPAINSELTGTETRAYVLDSHLQLLPIGITGELYVGETGIPRGYVADPSKTAEEFVADPFDGPGARLFKTGLSARYHSGGIVVTGRLARLVNLRGVKIDLDEVEKTLVQHPEILRAGAVLRSDEFGEERLVAYFEAQPGQTVSPEDLLASLAGELPSYMLPYAVVELSELPLTPDGNVDHQRLPTTFVAPGRPDVLFVGPRTPTEEAVSEIWKEVLQRSDFGIYEKFFDLGGDSLNIIRAFLLLDEIYPNKLTVVDLFKYNTIAAIADYLEEHAAQAELVTQGFEL
ncbi:MAG TPA: amino acid adenylation domain-containing protein [Pyrinomonadaceae bacterium]